MNRSDLASAFVIFGFATLGTNAEARSSPDLLIFVFDFHSVFPLPTKKQIPGNRAALFLVGRGKEKRKQNPAFPRRPLAGTG